MASSTRLTDDILLEIFTYLPLNSIYKFKCLSKVWLSNLSNPNFIIKWFEINNESLPWIFYQSIAHLKNPLRFRNAYHELHSDFMSKNEHLFSFKFLMNQKPIESSKLYLLGSSCGLVLCWSEDQIYHVCNPLTQKWVSLPPPPSSAGTALDVIGGIFCEYSSSFTSCYKVIRIPSFHMQVSKKFIVDIFRSDLGFWKRIQVSCDENVGWGYIDKVVIVNGVLFWIEERDRLLVYNLNQKNISDGHRCSLVNLPDIESVDDDDDDDECRILDSCIGESEGWLCYARTETTVRRITVSVWVLEEVNWKILRKDISINGGILAEMHSRIGGAAPVEVLGFSPVNRNVVLFGCKDWVRGFNIQTRNFEELHLDNRHDIGEMYWPFVLKPMPTLLPSPLG